MRTLARIAATAGAIAIVAGIGLTAGAGAASADTGATTTGATTTGATVTPAPFSVTIALPDDYTVTGPGPIPLLVPITTTGFSVGNWANVWVTGADGVQQSVGGTWMRYDGQAVLSGQVMQPGDYTVQVSVGKWPAEQWSQVITLHVVSTSALTSAA